jgi:carbonic anhydrase
MAGHPAGAAELGPDEALRALLDGNSRFVAGRPLHPNQSAEHRAGLATAQHPFAVLFGCSDSRLAAEIVFDCGLGDLFVVRTAGHILGPEVLGTIDFGVAMLDVPLVVVLGHDSCGAVGATMTALRQGTPPPGNLRIVVDRVALTIEAELARGTDDPQVISDAHVRHTAVQLRRRSPLVDAAVREGRTRVVPMSYRLADGTVRRLDR